MSGVIRPIVLCCSCSGQDRLAKEAFSLLFPGVPVPEVVKGRDRLYKLYQETKNEHIKAISQLKGKFAYLVELDESDTIVKEIDLLTGRRLA